MNTMSGCNELNLLQCQFSLFIWVQLFGICILIPASQLEIRVFCSLGFMLIEDISTGAITRENYYILLGATCSTSCSQVRFVCFGQFQCLNRLPRPTPATVPIINSLLKQGVKIPQNLKTRPWEDTF